jgi:hypothetical protein
MISEQTVHAPTSALRVHPFAETAVAVNTGIRSTGLPGPLRTAADQAKNLTTAVFGALGLWATPALFERLHHVCLALSSDSTRVCRQALEAAWSAYVNAHTFTLDNGRSVWIDEYQTVFIDITPGDDTPTLTQGSMSEYDHWLEAQVWAC